MSLARLELDFIAPARKARAAGLVVLAAALVIAGLLVTRFYEVKTEIHKIELTQGLRGDNRIARTLSRERVDEEIKSVEATLRQLTLPWGTIIETVEAAATPDVAILQMQPDAQQRLLRLGLEARNQEAMLEYLRQLTAAKALTEVYVLSHQVQTDDPQHPIQFSVQARWKGMP